MTSTSATPASSPPPVAGLEFQEKIGEGGAGVVYRAVHRTLQRTVAVKVLPGASAPTGPGWLSEPRLMAALAHPHVVAVHDAGHAGGHNFLVMEYMAGGSLRSRMEPGRPWPLDRAAAVLDQVAAALDHVHGEGVLHLDLKPENVLFAADGRVKVTDFGLSAPSADPRTPGADGRLPGTLDYAAPEVLAGRPPDPRYDVFSLATVAYELLTGRFPGRVYVPASRRNPALPAAVDHVLRRGLARDPEQRYATVAEFRRAFGDACRPPAARVRTGPTLAAAALAAGLAVLLAVGGWWRITRPVALPPAETVGPPPAASPPPAADRPTRLWVLYDQPDDLSMLTGAGGGELATDPGVAVERVLVEDQRQGLPPELPLPVWPRPRPVLVVHSPGAWGFVHPLRDPTLGQRVVRNWPELLRAAVPPEKNLVKAGGFDGDCLAPDDRGNPDLWRVDRSETAVPLRKVTLTPPGDRPDNPALLLTNLDPARRDVLGCSQPATKPPPPGSVVALRYRARADTGAAQLQVYLRLPVGILPGETGAAATRIRALNTPPPQVPDLQRTVWPYRVPAHVTPTEDWQTYLVVCDVPPFPTRATYRSLVVEVLGTGRVWVDDVELFTWQPGGAP